MDCTGKIIRTSIHTFLKHFHYFTTIPILLLLPFSASALLSLSQFDSLLFDLALKSQTLFPFVFTLPFAFSSFIIAKASIIQAFNQNIAPSNFQSPFLSSLPLYKPLLLTHLCSLALIIAINSAAFFLLIIPLNSLISLWLPYVSLAQPAFGAVSYSFLASTVVVSNLALVVAGMGSCEGHVAINKACLLRRGKNCMALMLFLPTNLGLVSIEALFELRVIRVYKLQGGLNASLALEGLLIAYLYSLLIVLDTIICCIFYKSCQIHSSNCYDIELALAHSQERESF